MKKIICLLSIIVLVLLVSGCTDVKDTDAYKFKTDYEALNGKETSTTGVYYRTITIDEDNPMVYSTFKELKEKIENKETFLVYVGFASCPWCRSIIPYVIEEAKKYNIDKIYYINVREDNQKESDLRGYFELDENNKPVYSIYPDKYYHDFIDTLSEFLTPYTLTDAKNKTVETGENRLYAPTLIVYKEGVATYLDECISEYQESAYEDLTDEIIEDTKQKIDKVFDNYQESCSVDGKSCN